MDGKPGTKHVKGGRPYRSIEPFPPPRLFCVLIIAKKQGRLRDGNFSTLGFFSPQIIV